MKIFNFSVDEISGRTFEIPYDKAIQIIKENCKDKLINYAELTEYETAKLLWDYCYDDIAEHELDNNSFQSNIDETKIYDRESLYDCSRKSDNTTNEMKF